MNSEPKIGSLWVSKNKIKDILLVMDCLEKTDQERIPIICWRTNLFTTSSNNNNGECFVCDWYFSESLTKNYMKISD